MSAWKHATTWRCAGAAGTLLLAIGTVIQLAHALAPFTPAQAPVGYVAQDEMSNHDLRSGSEIVYRTEYEKEFFSGNLYAYPVDALGRIAGAPEWWGGGAQVHVDAQDFDTGRLIATMKDSGAGAGAGVAFRFASLSATQQGYLGSASVLNFLRGERSQEIPNAGKTLRQRKSALGDIVHSRPFYLKDASNPTVFVGANDGMLHAIDAATSGGRERWAYVPSMLINKMKSLSVSPYVHDYFVDGQINIASISSSGSKRVLVGGLGGGGKGLYALDITGSAGLTAGTEADVAAKVLWEITPATVNYTAPTSANAYANLGYTYGTPTIARIGSADRVIVGNGYNNGGDYQAYLFVIDAYTGQRIAAIQAGNSGSAASLNGLSTPVAVDTDGDGSVDRVYAGDLNGSMWKFDLGAGTASALLVTSPPEPITTTPGISMHPSGGYMVNFGTGRMFGAADSSDASTVYHAYGVWDGASASAMVTQTLTERAYTMGSTTTRVRTVTANPMDWTRDKGWQVTLAPGERVVGEGSFVENGRFYFNAYNPTVTTAIPASSTVVSGSNWLIELDALSGGSKNSPFLDMNGDVKLDATDRVLYAAGDTIPAGAAVGSPIMSTDGIPVARFLAIGVMSQPILVQLESLNDTLFNQNPDVTIAATALPETGVVGGHFDVDVFYGSTCTDCNTKSHTHQYDDKFDVTGVDMLNPSEANLRLSKAIPSTNTAFKVLAMNQYLSPAVKLHIGNPAYLFNVDVGYLAIKDYLTSAPLDVTAIQSYTRLTIGSLVVNMPLDALTSRDWWGNGDVRSGLHPVGHYLCPIKSATSANDGNMFRPVLPPANGVAGPGAAGWSSATSPASASGARHNGALTIQIISAGTPNSAIEANVAGRPEYGWRVQSASYAAYVLAEYVFFWHTPHPVTHAQNTGPCYHDASWSKTPAADPTYSALATKAGGSTDPKIGDLSAGGSGATVTGTATVVSGNVTTTVISFSASSKTATIVRTANADGSVTIVTTDLAGAVTTQTIANTAGSQRSGGDERGLQARTGRIGWRELLAP